MKLYNTLTKKIEDFIPHDENIINLYTCGPTVYHYAHIGNLRTYIMEDILEKSLKYLGYNVKRVMNITDVGHLTNDSDFGNDKMVESAKKEHKTVMDIAKYYTESFFEDCKKLNITTPEIVSPATSNIDEYIKIIQKLIEKDTAYFSNGNIYFDTSKLKEYYKLTNHDEKNLLIGARDDVNEDVNKKNKTDFVLWFTKSKFENQELKWDSPWGVGYPGWHIECSGIAIKYLGEHIDIHCGGVDNIFPHHTNEIAQSEAFLGHKWCNYWFHVEHLNDANGKMSKSHGDALVLKTIIEKDYNPLSYRYFCLCSHYRNQLVFSYENLSIAQNSYYKLKNKINQLKNEGEILKEKFEKYNNSFKEAISNDINTSNMITTIYDVLKDEMMNDKTKLELIKSFDKVLGLDLIEKNEELEEEIVKLIEERNIAKQNKNYELSDKIRDDLLKKGIKLLDTKEGTTWTKNW